MLDLSNSSAMSLADPYQLAGMSPADVGAAVLNQVGNMPAARRSHGLNVMVQRLVQAERNKSALVHRQLQTAQGQITVLRRENAQVKAELIKLKAYANRAVQQLRHKGGFKAPTTVVPLDSGSVGINGDALTPTFIISPGVNWQYLGLIVSEVVANNFVLNVFTVAGFPNISQGVNVQNNGTNAGLGLAPFVLNSTSPMVLPFAGRTFGAQVPLTLQARSITPVLTQSRFVAVVLLGLDIHQVCNPSTLQPIYGQQQPRPVFTAAQGLR